jgi:hypothetical protein
MKHLFHSTQLGRRRHVGKPARRGFDSRDLRDNDEEVSPALRCPGKRVIAKARFKKIVGSSLPG